MSLWTPARNLTLRSHFGADRHSTLSLATLYFGLMQGDPAGAGVEPTSAGGYARVAKANDATLWGTISGSAVSVSNVDAVVWPTATAVWSITTALDYWFIADNSAGGAIWYSGLLSSTITISGAGDVARLPIGTVAVTALGT